MWCQALPPLSGQSAAVSHHGHIWAEATAKARGSHASPELTCIYALVPACCCCCHCCHIGPSPHPPPAPERLNRGSSGTCQAQPTLRPRPLWAMTGAGCRRRREPRRAGQDGGGRVRLHPRRGPRHGGARAAGQGGLGRPGGGGWTRRVVAWVGYTEGMWYAGRA